MKHPVLVRWPSASIRYERRDWEAITAADVPQYRQAETKRDGPRVSQLHGRAVTESDHTNKQLADRKQDSGTKIPDSRGKLVNINSLVLLQSGAK